MRTFLSQSQLATDVEEDCVPLSRSLIRGFPKTVFHRLFSNVLLQCKVLCLHGQDWSAVPVCCQQIQLAVYSMCGQLTYQHTRELRNYDPECLEFWSVLSLVSVNWPHLSKESESSVPRFHWLHIFTGWHTKLPSFSSSKRIVSYNREVPLRSCRYFWYLKYLIFWKLMAVLWISVANVPPSRSMKQSNLNGRSLHYLSICHFGTCSSFFVSTLFYTNLLRFHL